VKIRIAAFVLVSIAIYFGIAAGLILFGTPGKAPPPRERPAFDELLFDYSALPKLRRYKARDGSTLEYRYYPSASDRALVLLHGSGWHSRYFLPLAKFISGQDLAKVYTPDLRGHGHHPKRRGDVGYIGQYEDDLADLIDEIRRRHAPRSIVVGGHSSGGGLAIRFAGSRYGKLADAYLLLAPFLKYNAPTVRERSGGWATPYTGRIIGLTMLNNVGIHLFDNLKAIEFNLPEAYRDGTETLAYTHRLNTAYAPADYTSDLAAMTGPLKVIVGAADEVFSAAEFAPAITPYAEADITLIPDVTHIGGVVGPEVRPVVAAWLNQLK